MKLTIAGVLAMAVMGLFMTGCIEDDSLPSRPRTRIITEDEKAQENAEKRTNEAPRRELPTSGAETPGGSKAESIEPKTVALLGDMYGGNYHYAGSLPMLPEKPGTVPTVGFTMVPGTKLAIEHSWGEVLPLVNYQHRPWADTQTTYVPANVKVNPVLFFNLSDKVNVPKPECDYGTDFVNAHLDVPWFYVNTVALPVLMLMECPWGQKTAGRLGQDPNYLGYLPKGGEIVPAPVPGEFKYDYDFLPNPPSQTQPTTQNH